MPPVATDFFSLLICSFFYSLVKRNDYKTMLTISMVCNIAELNKRGGTTLDTRQLIEKYHHAWTTGDFVTARTCLADNLDFQGSINTFSKADDFISALTQFKQMLAAVTVLNSFYDKQSAALLYDCDSESPAGNIRTAEFFTVSNNKISAIRLVFDSTELRKLVPNNQAG